MINSKKNQSKDKPQICKTGQHVLKSEQKYCVIYVSYIYRLIGKGGGKGDECIP